MSEQRISADPQIGDRVYRKVTRRLLPVMGLCYFLSYLDRTNVAIAKIGEGFPPEITDAVFGLGSGLFFIGYLVFEVPSNMAMHRFGARIWMTRIMVTWGIVACCQAFISGATSFYVIRILLGVAEAGFFPGMLLYMTYWFTQQQRAKIVGLFMAMVPLSTALGAPIGGLLLKMHDFLGLDGWRWLFLIEGIPTIILGAMLWKLLTDRPEQADWLEPEEKRWLTTTLDEQNRRTESTFKYTVRQALVQPRILLLSLVYFGLVTGLYGIGFWLPTIIKGHLSNDNFVISLYTAIPYVIGTAAIIWWGKVVDRSNEYVWRTAIPCGVGGLALMLTALLSSNPWVGYVGMCICAIAVVMTFPGFWRLPSAFLTGAAAAAGLAMINSLGNLSGWAAPTLVGKVKQATGDPKWGLIAIGISMVVAAVIVVFLKSAPTPRGGETIEAGSEDTVS
ncbi:MFS transporter [Nakamurella sp. A5-74]|uniref:MFS transporter n=1 Tax=Nakamurella sp. A5-74 TaxID=3158264 RepID=A0AAU8DVY4_9ACTN